MKYIFCLSIQVFLDSLNLNIFFTTMASKNVSNRVFMVHLIAERFFSFTLYLWITSWAVIIVWIYLSFFFLFVFFVFLLFFLFWWWQWRAGVSLILCNFLCPTNLYLFTRYLLMLFIIFFFTFLLCGLRGTNKLYCSWSPLWFRSAKMAIKTYDFLRDPKFTTYDYVPCTSLISGMDPNHYFILIQQFLATVLEVLQFYII